MEKREYSNYDFEQLTEIYFKNSWLRNKANHVGFEGLWFDYSTKKEKRIVKKLISKFNYISLEQAEIDFQPLLKQAISEWGLNHTNTIFVAFKPHKYADGSAMLLQFLKGILYEIDDEWSEGNLYSRLKYGNERIKAGGNKEFGIELKNVVLIDDFIGTGRTAVNTYNQVQKEIANSGFEIDLYVLTLGGMNFGLRHLYKKTNARYKNLYTQSKGSDGIESKKEKRYMKKIIFRMETILSKGNINLKLEDHRLGWGQSEAAYNVSRFNIPNNNYPIFWWNRYRNEEKRKPIFNRMQ